MNTEKIVLGTLAGVAAGAVLGLLFAPDKGSSTRKKITDKGNAFADDLSSKYNDLKSEFAKTVERVRDEYASIIQDGQGKEEEVTRMKSHQGNDTLVKPFQGKGK